MRLGRLVAAGLAAGAVAGFVGALLRPRSVRTYGAGTTEDRSADEPTDHEPTGDVGPPTGVPAPSEPVRGVVTRVPDADPDTADREDALAVAGAADPFARSRGAAG